MTTEENRTHPLEGYAPGNLTRRNFATLEESVKLTGEIINEVGRRIANSAPHVDFLDSTFLYKVAPANEVGGRCTIRFWTGVVGNGAKSKLGTAKEVVIAPHCVPNH